jgi:hypothetical protein
MYLSADMLNHPNYNWRCTVYLNGHEIPYAVSLRTVVGWWGCVTVYATERSDGKDVPRVSWSAEGGQLTTRRRWGWIALLII